MANVLKDTLRTANFLVSKYDTFTPTEEKELIELLEIMKHRIQKRVMKKQVITQGKVISLDKYRRITGLK